VMQHADHKSSRYAKKHHVGLPQCSLCCCMLKLAKLSSCAVDSGSKPDTRRSWLVFSVTMIV
jgi:hypothetical protein